MNKQKEYKGVLKAQIRYKKALSKSTKVDLLRVIRAALSCGEHTIEMPITTIYKENKYETFSYTPNTTVLCELCTRRLRAALCLEKDEVCPNELEYEGW